MIDLGRAAALQFWSILAVAAVLNLARPAMKRLTRGWFSDQSSVPERPGISGAPFCAPVGLIFGLRLSPSPGQCAWSACRWRRRSPSRVCGPLLDYV